ncbi:MAG: nodulation protein NfeD [Acidobacteriota bacterium]|nr:nodulation protein NfeD [Acidobacteriota bacterium]
MSMFVLALAGLSTLISFGHFTRAAAPAAAAPTASAKIVELHISDEIEPVLAEYITSGIAQANRENASLILITMDTPGGLETSMREIIQSILQSKVPVATYVYPTGSRAASAGFFILLSADVDAMSPGTETGAASPIMEIGGQTVQIDPTLRKKIFNDAEAFLRSYVGKRGRSVDTAMTAVSDAKAFSDTEALKENLIDLIATSPENLLTQLNGRAIKRLDGSTETLNLSNPIVEPVGMTSRERFLSRIVQPDVFFVLLIIGVLGLYAEFTHPGMFAPGVIGAIALVLALFAMHLLPINLTGLLLIAAAFVLFILEAKFPTHGILGVGGVIAMVLGALMLIRTPLTGMGVSVGVAFGVAIPFAVMIIVLMRLVLRSFRWKPATGKEELVGTEAEVIQPIGAAGAAGLVRVHGELWRAVIADGPVPQGARVRVKKIDGLTLEVESIEASQAK